MNINKLIYWGATLWTVGTFGAGYLFYTTRNDYVEFKKQHHEQLTNQEALKAHDIHTTAQYTIGRLDKLISGDTKIGRFYLSTIEESINVRSEEQIVQQYLAVRKNFEDLRLNPYLLGMRAEKYEQDLVGGAIHKKDRLFIRDGNSFFGTMVCGLVSISSWLVYGVCCLIEKIEKEKAKEQKTLPAKSL